MTRCPSCDTVVFVEETDEGPRYRYRGALSIGTTPCPFCEAPLCRSEHPVFAKLGHPCPPRCDLWFGHPGLHRYVTSTRVREDIAWGEGEASWERGKLVKTTKFEGYSCNDASNPRFVLHAHGPSYRCGPSIRAEDGADPDGEEKCRLQWWDLLPDVGDRKGDWIITVTFQPKETT